MVRKSVWLLITSLIFFKTLETARSLHFNPKTNTNFLVEQKKERPLFADEFVTTPIQTVANKKQWSINICNPSFFSTRAKTKIHFSGKIQSIGKNRKTQKDSHEEYYKVIIETISPDLYSVTIPSAQTFIGNWAIPKQCGLDDKISLRNNTFCTIRSFLNKKHPAPYLTFNNPVVQQGNKLFQVLGKIEIFKQDGLETQNKSFCKNKYMAKYTDQNQKTHSHILEPRELLFVKAYDRCRTNMKIQSILLPLRNLLSKKNIFKIQRSECFDETIQSKKNNRAISRPGLILLQSEDSKNYGVIYQPIKSLSKNLTPVFSKDIVWNITPKNKSIRLQIIDQDSLKKINFTQSELI